MSADDHPLLTLRPHWQDASVPTGLADTILIQTHTLPRHEPWQVRTKKYINQLLTHLDHTDAGRSAVLIAMLVLGMLSMAAIDRAHAYDLAAPGFWVETL